MKNNKYPEGTIFSGELAFVPLEEGGFKTVNLNTGVEYDSFSDSIYEDDLCGEDAVVKDTSIEFNIDYDGFVMEKNTAKPKDNAKKELKVETKKEDIEPEIEVKPEKKKIENIHAGHRERMKKRFEDYGLENFSEHEVLEFLLYFVRRQGNTNDIAHRLINEFGDINRVFKADKFDLQSVNGIGEQSALLITFVRHLMKYLNANVKEKVCLSDTTKAGLFCCNYFMQHTEESFITIMLDSNKCVQKIVVISKGTENDTAYYPRNVIKETIKHKANMVLIAHNHTGNNVHPSNNDVVLSNEINELLEGIGVPLVDHIICSGNLFTSLSERDLIK